MRLARARWFVLVGLVFSGCLLPDVDLVPSFGDGGAAGNGQSGAGNDKAGSAADSAGTSSSTAGSGATPGAGGDPGSGGTEPDSGAPGVGGTVVSTAGTDAGGKGGSNPGTAGASGGGAGGSAGSGGSGLVSNPHSWAAWPMPNAVSASLPNPASYDLATAGLVKDKVTGLMWQRQVTATMGSFDVANTYCAGLTLAGFSDWRVPTRIELVSIIDYTVAPPAAAIDPTAFPNTPSERYWTASTLWGNPDYAFQCQFLDGSVNTWAKNGNQGTPRVRCVRP